MSNLDEKYKKLEESKVEDELKGEELSIAQKKALIKKAKEENGPGWKKVLGVVGSLGKGLKVNSENMSAIYSSGLGDLRELSNPSSNFGRGKNK